MLHHYDITPAARCAHPQFRAFVHLMSALHTTNQCHSWLEFCLAISMVVGVVIIRGGRVMCHEGDEVSHVDGEQSLLLTVQQHSQLGVGRT